MRSEAEASMTNNPSCAHLTACPRRSLITRLDKKGITGLLVESINDHSAYYLTTRDLRVPGVK